MRIQETDKILKDSRVSRHNANHHQESGVINRVWKKLTTLWKH